MATILLADDDAITRDLLSRLLSTQGYSVISVRNGLEALAALDTTHIDLVITDLRMPLLDGASLAEVVRAGSGGTHLIVLSGDLRAPGVAAAVRAADAALAKPVQPDGLLQTVAELLATTGG